MCVVAIIDANALSVLVSRQDPGDALFRLWIDRRHGVLAFSSSGQFRDEIRKNRAVMELILRYDQGGQLKKIPASELSCTTGKVDKGKLLSNDLHVLALALASDATVLCSNDIDLCSDFKDTRILPSVGRFRRRSYPINGTLRQRRKFLNARRCSKRERN